MLFHKLPHRTTVYASFAGALALALSFSQQAIAEHKCGAGMHAHHNAEKMDVKRSMASYAVPKVTLLDQNGNKVALTEVLDTDQPLMLNFIFTSCTAICPVMSATFAGVQRQLGSDSEKIRMISVSIDPEYDTPDALNDYAKRFKAGSQWQFLTGSLDDSIAVQQAFDADRGDKMNHIPMTLMRANRDSQWVRYEGFASADELVKEVRNML